MEWKVKIPDSYEKQNTMTIDRSKVEALKAIAEQLERIAGQLKEIKEQEKFYKHGRA